MDYKIVIDKVISISSEYGIKVIGAFVIWIVGSWIIKKLMKAANALMDKSHYESLRSLIEAGGYSTGEGGSHLLNT